MLNIIVLLDDNKATNFIHEKFIVETGSAKKVIVFEEGQEALDYLNTCEQHPDLIFLDINMPTMNAWEFLEKYNQLTPPRYLTKIILLTTCVSPEDENNMKNYPILVEMLLKPLNKDTIQKIVNKYFDVI